MQKHEIFTSQEGLDLMDFVNFQVEQGINLARSKGHKFYAYSLEFKVDEERQYGYIAIPTVKDYSSNTLEDVKEYCVDWVTYKCFNIENDKIKPI